MYQALLLKQTGDIHIPGGRTVYHIMEETGSSRRPERKPSGITKAGHEVRKSGGLLKREFASVAIKTYIIFAISGYVPDSPHPKHSFHSTIFHKDAKTMKEERGAKGDDTLFF